MVIGIISVLIAILLPSLNKAREAAKTVACLSNLRQVALAMRMYAESDKGNYFPIAREKNDPNAAKGSDGKPYGNVNIFWWNKLTMGSFLSVIEDADNSVLMCPSGGPNGVKGNDIDLTASQRGDLNNMEYITGYPDANWKWVRVNYAVNATSSGNTAQGDFRPFFPMAVYDHAPGGTKASPMKAGSIRHASELLLIYDGFFMQSNQAAGNKSTYSYRHGGGKICNVAFADGHAESVQKSRMPQWDVQQGAIDSRVEWTNLGSRYAFQIVDRAP